MSDDGWGWDWPRGPLDPWEDPDWVAAVADPAYAAWKDERGAREDGDGRLRGLDA